MLLSQKTMSCFNSVHYLLIIDYTIFMFRTISGINIHTVSPEETGPAFPKASLRHSVTPKPLAEVAVVAGGGCR